MTTAKPRNNAIVVTISKYNNALAPILPTFFKSPPPAIPITIVEKTRGAIIDLIRLRKISRTKDNCEEN